MDVNKRLSDLPSELLSIIVGHLAPSYENRFKPGQKKDLQSANFAHRCLRQWVPQFLFRNMCLMVVTFGLSSKLEGMLLDPLGLELAKHTRNVQLKVPPTIREEVDETPRTSFESTTLRLLSRFGVQDEKSLTFEQREFCFSYDFAMVVPFKNIRWIHLFPQAQHACMQVFRQLPKLEHVEVGICGRVDHPDPTTTNAFIKRWGRDVITHENPACVEDPILNLTWASGVIIQTIPEKVKSLHLSAANLVVLSWLTYEQHDIPYNPARNLLSVTNLTLDIRGIQGTHHSTPDWYTRPKATTEMVRYWAKTINSLPKLVHLQLNGKFGDVIEKHRDKIDLALRWLLPTVKQPLQSLSLRNFGMSVDILLGCLLVFGSSLKSLVLDEIVMLDCEYEEEEAPWLMLATWAKDYTRGTRIRVNHPYNYRVPVSQSSLNKMSAMGMQVTG